MIPYVETERKRLQLHDEHPALVILDVIFGQMTNAVLENLNVNNIKLVCIPPLMTNIFQLLDFTVNGSSKAYMKQKFSHWYSQQKS